MISLNEINKTKKVLLITKTSESNKTNEIVKLIKQNERKSVELCESLHSFRYVGSFS